MYVLVAIYYRFLSLRKTSIYNQRIGGITILVSRGTFLKNNNLKCQKLITITTDTPHSHAPVKFHFSRQRTILINDYVSERILCIVTADAHNEVCQCLALVITGIRH